MATTALRGQIILLLFAFIAIAVPGPALAVSVPRPEGLNPVQLASHRCPACRKGCDLQSGACRRAAGHKVPPSCQRILDNCLAQCRRRECREHRQEAPTKAGRKNKVGVDPTFEKGVEPPLAPRSR